MRLLVVEPGEAVLEIKFKACIRGMRKTGAAIT